MHGGDVYRNNVSLDFSVNLNPLGVPPEVQWVLTEAALHANKYPDIVHERLLEETSGIFGVSKENIVYGNGASEIMMAICHAFMPESVMLVAPCFLGYEHCILGANHTCNIYYHYLKETDDFVLTEDIIPVIKKEKPNLLFLTNPNNPNGLLIDKGLLERMIMVCQEVGTTVILDECFLTLTGREKELSLAYNIRNYKSLIVIRAFTKTFAIPGVRLGYAICSKSSIADKIKSHLPEWNLSIFAQMAGVECLKHMDYLEESVKLISGERDYLSNGLKESRLTVFPSNANFIMFKSRYMDLKKRLLNTGILIRDCSDFKGLDKGFYRAAIRNHEDNVRLIKELVNSDHFVV